MRNLLAMLGVLILSGFGLALADQGVVKPLANPQVNTSVNTSANVNANVNKGDSQTEVNENDSESVNAKASLRANDEAIHQVRVDMTRDIKKLRRDRVRLKTAVAQKDDEASTKVKSDIDSDETAIEKDRIHLKDYLKSKVESDRATISEYAQKVRDTRKVVERDEAKLTRDAAKLADAQKRNAADDIARFQTAVDKEKSVLAADKEKLRRRNEYKDDIRVALKNDRHHLDVEIKRLAADKTSASETTDVESEESTK